MRSFRLDGRVIPNSPCLFLERYKLLMDFMSTVWSLSVLQTLPDRWLRRGSRRPVARREPRRRGRQEADDHLRRVAQAGAARRHRCGRLSVDTGSNFP
eukprot:7271751-Prymnesium_polylepis.1